MKQIIWVLAFLLANVAGADVINAVDVTASSYWGDVVSPTHIIDGSGWTRNTPLESSTHLAGEGANQIYWHANEPTANVWVAFDLGGYADLEHMVVWNFNANIGDERLRSVQQYDLILADLSLNWADVPGTMASATIASFNDLTLDAAGGVNGELGQVVDFADTANVRYVVINVDSNYDGSNYTGLSEVRFEGTLKVIPVPQQRLIRNVTATANDETYGSAMDLVNGAGIYPDWTSWADAAGGGMWLSDQGQSSYWVRLDFSEVYELGQMYVWNHNQTNLLDRGLKDVIVEYSSDGTHWTTLGNYVIPQGTGEGDPAIAWGNGMPMSSIIDFGGIEAGSVRITAAATEGNYGSAYYGLGEVRFGTLSDQDAHLNQQDILLHWAPVVYQDMLSGTDWFRQMYTAGDCILGIDFDGDWNMANNWDNSHYQVHEQGQLSDRLTPPLYGKSYVSYVESDDFFFLGYGFYHARDDAGIEADRHQNDWEMIVMAVQKDGSDYGQLRAMMTQYHTEEKLYDADDFLYSGHHPIIAIQPNGTLNGHGIVAWNGSNMPDPGSDGVRYIPAEYSQNVTGYTLGQGDNWATAPAYNYKLLPIEELWCLRGLNGLYDPYISGHYTKFNYERAENSPDGSYVSEGGGNVPWERPYFTDPVAFFRDNFSFLAADLAGQGYMHNPYYSNDWGDVGPFNDEGIFLPTSYSQSGIGGVAGLFAEGRQSASVSAKCQNISATSDRYYFGYQPVSDKIELTGRILTVQHITDQSNAGLMMRESLSGNAKMVYLYVTPNYQVHVVSRDQTGAAVVASAGAIPADDRPVWLKIRKESDQVTTYYSYSEPANYVLFSSHTIAMSSPLAGVAAASEDSNRFAAASLSNLDIYYLKEKYDLDGNGLVGFGDLEIISRNWLNGPNLPGDFYEDADEIVNLLDLAEFSGFWLE